MSPERVLFAFVIVLALTLNAGYSVGDRLPNSNGAWV